MWFDVVLALAVIAVPLALAWLVLTRRERQQQRHAATNSRPFSESKR